MYIERIEIEVGTQLKVLGTNKTVTITKIVDDYLALYSGENCGGAITKKHDGNWHSVGMMPICFHQGFEIK